LTNNPDKLFDQTWNLDADSVQAQRALQGVITANLLQPEALGVT